MEIFVNFTAYKQTEHFCNSDMNLLCLWLVKNVMSAVISVGCSNLVSI